jgi:hypothetical protein
MAILWCGGEDIDFPNGSACSTVTTTTYFRTAYARGSVYGSTGTAWSQAFPGGAVTSAWLSYQWGFFPENSNGSLTTGKLAVGLGNTSFSDGRGIWLRTSTTGGWDIVKFDGTTVTALATGGAALWGAVITQGRVDMQISSYGSSSSINLYVNGNFYLGFTGNSSVTSLTNLNSVLLAASPSGNFGVVGNGSEFIVADEDTRSFSLKTMAPAGAGTTTNWTGLFSAINPVTQNDANAVFTNTVAQDTQFTTTGLPAGTFAVRQVKVTARMAATAGSTATKVATGFNLGGTVSVGTPFGPLGTAFSDKESFYNLNPVTSAAWTTTQLSTAQIDLESS